jgi:hypothetical protein
MVASLDWGVGVIARLRIRCTTWLARFFRWCDQCWLGFNQLGLLRFSLCLALWLARRSSMPALSPQGLVTQPRLEHQSGICFSPSSHRSVSPSGDRVELLAPSHTCFSVMGIIQRPRALVGDQEVNQSRIRILNSYYEEFAYEFAHHLGWRSSLSGTR